jgi:cytochrome c oxidase subunit 2
MKNISIILILIIVSIIVERLFFLSKIQYQSFNQNKTNTAVNNSIDEINIISERYMFSPMLVRLKRGKTVRLVLSTYDVQHGIFQPDLKINLSAYPGKPAENIIEPDKVGEYTVTCSLYCGVDHNKMKMTFIVYE